MAMVKQSSSRYEQKRISRLESVIRAAQQSGVSSDQIKQIVRKVYRVKKHDTEEGNGTRLDVDRLDGVVSEQVQMAAKVHKHVVLPADTYQRFEGKRSQRLSRPVTKMFLDHPERLEQYHVLRDHRFSRFMAIDIITKSYSEKGYNKGGTEEIPPKETYPLDLAAPAWQKLMGEHKTLFSKMYDRRIQEGLSHLQAINSIFREMDRKYRATKGKSIFDQIEGISKQVDFASKDGLSPDFTAKGWKPDLKRRYYKRFQQGR